MEMMDIPDLPHTDLGPRLSLPPPTYTPLQPAQVTGRKSEAQKTLNSSSHQTTILSAAQTFCESQQYVDVHIQCEDGIVSAHQMMLAVASPFLKQLFEAAGLDKVPAGVQDHEPLQLVLPEVKTSLVQALLHFLYTGNVVTQEGQFYSLMKLVYALNINASIEAESTPDSPTLFNTLIRSSSAQLNSVPMTCNCGGSLNSKNGKFDIDSENNLLNSISFNKVTNGLAVNSFTASGVVVKEELEEKPSFLNDLVDDKTMKNDYTNLLQETTTQTSSNVNNNNQLGHFVSVNPGFQIKMEIPGAVSTSTSSAITSQAIDNNVNRNSNQSSSRQVENSSDDPLAAIMNQTIFGGDSMNTMFIQVNTNSFLSTQNSNISSNNGNVGKDISKCGKDGDGGTVGNGGPGAEDIPITPDDDDLNTSYSCDICSKPVKGKVMLQAHKFQEHHENPEFEASSFPEDKFACRVCLKLFTRNSDVKAHILRVHCGDRRYPCTMCGKRFKESTHLRKHLYTHTGERPHFCTLCSKGFQTSSDLKRHKKTRVHQEKVEQAGQNAIAASAGQPQPDLNLEYNDWTDTNNTEDKDLGASQGSLQNTFTVSSNSSSTSLPFSHSETNSDQRLVSVTTSSTNYINQNTQPYTTNHQSQDQKPLWSPDVGDATISSLMLSPNLITNSVSPASLQVQNCSLPSTTLDLSDIKWGILDQEPIKREASIVSVEKQINIQNIQ